MMQRLLSSEESSVAVTAYPVMTEEETREVIDLWMERQLPSANRPTTREVAESLDISPTEATQLLTEVRTRRIEAAQREAELERARLERVETAARLAEAEARLAEANARKRHAERDNTLSTKVHLETKLTAYSNELRKTEGDHHQLGRAIFIIILLLLAFTFLTLIFARSVSPSPLGVSRQIDWGNTPPEVRGIVLDQMRK